MSDKKSKGISYKDAGVDIDAGDEAARRIGRMAKSTFGPEVLSGMGGFAGLFSLGGEVKMFRGSYRDPVLVACTDGVGTKLMIAFDMDKHDTVGIDLVAMSVNDLVVQGAEALFFLDYIGTAQAVPERMAEIVKGITDGCQQARCALIGGETAELPGLYKPNEYDLAGFAVGVLERTKIIDGSKVASGDAILGLHSDGLHSNGFSLVRKVLLEHAGLKLEEQVSELGCALGEELLRPTKIYTEAVRAVLAKYQVKEIVKSLAHITGGGLPGNVPRALPKGTVARIDKKAWSVPPIFTLIQKAGNVEETEMYRTFNMGIGMTLVCPQFNVNAIQQTLKAANCESSVIGEISEGLAPDADAVVRME